MKIKCIVVDDEEGAIFIMEEYIRRLDHLALVGKFSNAVDAFQFVKRNEVGLIFLDINMPQVDGFGLLDMLETKPAVIFTTAYSHHALSAFNYGAVDYLHKPIRFERFAQAVEKARKYMTGDGSSIAVSKSIALKVDGSITEVPVGDIRYVSSLGNYCKVECTSGHMVTLMTMSEMESKLRRSIFVRVHKSYLVNLNFVTFIEKDYVRLNGARIPIGKTYKKYFYEQVKVVLGREFARKG